MITSSSLRTEPVRRFLFLSDSVKHVRREEKREGGEKGLGKAEVSAANKEWIENSFISSKIREARSPLYRQLR